MVLPRRLVHHGCLLEDTLVRHTSGTFRYGSTDIGPPANLIHVTKVGLSQDTRVACYILERPMWPVASKAAMGRMTCMHKMSRRSGRRSTCHESLCAAKWKGTGPCVHETKAGVCVYLVLLPCLDSVCVCGLVLARQT